MDPWLIVIVTLIFSAFFSGMEIAFISSNKLKIEVDKNKGLLSARILSSFTGIPSGFIGALLLGNNIALVVYGIAMALLLEPVVAGILPEVLHDEYIILICQTIISTLIILIVAEFIPKALFRINPNLILNLFAVPLLVFYFLFYPVIFLFIGISEWILKALFRMKFTNRKYVFSPIDLDEYVKEFTPGSGSMEEVDKDIQMFQNAIEFRNVKLRECMVPRTETVAAAIDDPVETLIRKFTESGHSKILIYRDTIDHIIGYAHSFDLFSNPASINDILKQIIIVPETMLANKVLRMMLQQHKSMAVVVDEFGGTSGIVTIEDIIEEIFGEIMDEYDMEEFMEKKVSNREYIFSARLKIDYLNEKYKLELPESDEYETLAGLIIHYHESIPQEKEEIVINRFVFTVMQATETKIEQVRLKIENGKS